MLTLKLLQFKPF